jgi:hypothetical protein
MTFDELACGRVVFAFGSDRIAPVHWWVVLDAAGRPAGVAWVAPPSDLPDPGPPGHAVEGTVDETPPDYATVTSRYGYVITIRPPRRGEEDLLRPDPRPEAATHDLMEYWSPAIKGRLRVPGGR